MPTLTLVSTLCRVVFDFRTTVVSCRDGVSVETVQVISRFPLFTLFYWIHTDVVRRDLLLRSRHSVGEEAGSSFLSRPFVLPVTGSVLGLLGLRYIVLGRRGMWEGPVSEWRVKGFGTVRR